MTSAVRRGAAGRGRCGNDLIGESMPGSATEGNTFPINLEPGTLYEARGSVAASLFCPSFRFVGLQAGVAFREKARDDVHEQNEPGIDRVPIF